MGPLIWRDILVCVKWIYFQCQYLFFNSYFIRETDSPSKNILNEATVKIQLNSETWDIDRDAKGQEVVVAAADFMSFFYFCTQK